MNLSSFDKIFVVADGICANDLFQAKAFSKGYNGKYAKTFSTNLFFFARIPFRFGNAFPYVTDNGIHCLSISFCW